MKKFIRLIALFAGVTLLALSFASCSGKKTIRIGILQTAKHASLDNCYEGLIQGLEEAGYKDGDNVEIDYQNALGQPDSFQQMAENMVGKKYDLVIGITTPTATALYAAARGKDIPVIFCAVSDPVTPQLVNSLDNPGNNCTGSTDLLNLEGQLKMIRALQPQAKKIGVLYNTAEPNSVTHLAELKKLAPTYQFEIVGKGIQSAADIPQTAASLAAEVDCINNFTDNLVVDNLSVVLEKAGTMNVPVYGSEIEQVKKGCLASESLDYVKLGQETGKLAARVLQGEKAAEIPVARVKDSFPVINTDVAAKYNITIPQAYASAEKVTTQADA